MCWYTTVILYSMQIILRILSMQHMLCCWWVVFFLQHIRLIKTKKKRWKQRKHIGKPQKTEARAWRRRGWVKLGSRWTLVPTWLPRHRDLNSQYLSWIKPLDMAGGCCFISLYLKSVSASVRLSWFVPWPGRQKPRFLKKCFLLARWVWGFFF